MLRLLAAGLNNLQIGERLMISPHTPIRHVSNIVTKADLSNCAGAATYIARHGILEYRLDATAPGGSARHTGRGQRMTARAQCRLTPHRPPTIARR